MKQFTEGIEKIYADLDGTDDLKSKLHFEAYGDQQDQQIFDILSDMESDIETGEYTQEEIVDKVADAIVVTTELGAKIEEAVEKFFFQLGLDGIPPDRRSRDYIDQTGEGTDVLNAKAVPDPVPGEPWVHSDDDFILFLDWLVKKDWSGRQIADVVAEPHHYTKHYKAFLIQKGKEEIDPLL